MDTSTSKNQVPASYSGPRFLGAPVGDFSLAQTILITVASGAVSFFAATFLAIMTLLVLTMFGRKPDFSLTYRWVGLPVGIAALVIAGIFLTSAWIRRVRHTTAGPR